MSIPANARPFVVTARQEIGFTSPVVTNWMHILPNDFNPCKKYPVQVLVDRKQEMLLIKKWILNAPVYVDCTHFLNEVDDVIDFINEKLTDE